MENEVGYMIVEIKSTEKDGKHFVFSSSNINGILYTDKEECKKRFDHVLLGFTEYHDTHENKNLVVSRRLSDDSYCFGFENKKDKGLNYVIFQIVEVPIP